MPLSPSGLRAGRAAITLSMLGGDVEKTLSRIEQRGKKIGQSLSRVAQGAAAAGAAMTGALAAAANSFARTGDQLDKMRARTGFSAESLSSLGFAAEQGGASIDQLDRSLAAMARFSIMVERGLKSSTDLLDMLGVSVDQFRNAAPEERFKLLADAISKVDDPSRRAGIALNVFGRSGRELLPMLEGGRASIEALQMEASALGITMTDEDATAAAKLTDALNRLHRQFKAVITQVGAAVAGNLQELADRMKEIGVTAIAWIKANRELIAGLARFVAKATVVVGTAYAIGRAITFASTAIGALRVAIVLLTAHPLVALASALAAIVLAVAHVTGAFDPLYRKLGLISDQTDDAADEFARLRKEMMAGLAMEKQLTLAEQLADKLKEIEASKKKAQGEIATHQQKLSDIESEIANYGPARADMDHLAMQLLQHNATLERQAIADLQAGLQEQQSKLQAEYNALREKVASELQEQITHGAKNTFDAIKDKFTSAADKLASLKAELAATATAALAAGQPQAAPLKAIARNGMARVQSSFSQPGPIFDTRLAKQMFGKGGEKIEAQQLSELQQINKKMDDRKGQNLRGLPVI